MPLRINPKPAKHQCVTNLDAEQYPKGSTWDCPICGRIWKIVVTDEGWLPENVWSWAGPIAKRRHRKWLEEGQK